MLFYFYSVYNKSVKLNATSLCEGGKKYLCV